MEKIILKATINKKTDVDIFAETISDFIKKGFYQEGKLINISDLKENLIGTKVVFQILKK